MDVFCEKLTNCEDPILVIAEILSKQSPIKTTEIEKEFKSRGLHKVKDLASASLSLVCTMNVEGDPLAKIYKAIEIYGCAHYADQLSLTMKKFSEGNFIKTIEVCEKMILSQPNDLNVLNLLAASNFNCGNYDKSLEYLEKVNRLKPHCYQTLSNIGSAYWKKLNYSAACIYYSKAICLKPDYLSNYINLAGALSQTDSKHTANHLYQSILKKDPNSYSVHNMSGLILLSLNKIKEAKVHFKTAMELAPKCPVTWYNLGRLYLITAKFEKAIFYYKRALELNPNLTIAWVNLGVAHFNLEDRQSSIQSYLKALILCPNNLKALNNLAISYERCLEDTPKAIECYKKCLELQPNNYLWSLKISLLIILKLKKYAEAESYLKKCVETNPQEKIAYKYLGVVYKHLKKLKCAAENFFVLGDLYYSENDYQNAYEVYTNALLLDPESVSGHWKLGRVMMKMGHDVDLALLRFKEAIELDPNFPNAYYDSALIFEAKNLWEKACRYYNIVSVLQPDHVNSLYNLTNLELKLGNYNNVVKGFKKILEIIDNSESFDVHLKLADILYKKLKNFSEALDHYEIALQLNITCLDVLLKMGNLLHDMDRSDDALRIFAKTLRLHPLCINTYIYIGSIYKDLKNFPEAIQAYKDALSIKPDFPDSYCNLVQCLQYVCDWSNYDLRIKKLKDIVHKQLDKNLVPSLLPHHSLYLFIPEVIKNVASMYADQCAEISSMEKRSNYSYQTSLSLLECIRVGYVSSDFGRHPTSQLMQTISKLHDRKKIEVFCYSLSPNDSSPSWSKISTESDHLRDISCLSVVDAANIINKDKIHILVNMNGYTKGVQYEIFALRPAPIQVLWLGHPGTSGATFIDYLITDYVCSPFDLKHLYSEQLVYLRQSVFVGDHKQIYGNLLQRVSKNTLSANTLSMKNKSVDFDKSSYKLCDFPKSMYSLNKADGFTQYYSRALCNIPEDAVVYCNFSQLYKIDPSTFSMWATILHNVPNSVLWLLRFPADGEVNLRESAAKLDIDMSRIIFSDFEPKFKHITRIQLADVFLDTPLRSSHTACLDALWAGTPVVTLPRETYMSRVAASQLTTLGTTSTIAQDEKDYIEIATRLGTDKNFLESLRQNIWSLKYSSKLFDCQSYANELETVYEDMWKKFISEDDHMEI